MNVNFKQLDSYLQNNTSHLDFFLVGDDFGQVIYVTEKLLEKYFKDEDRHIEKLEHSALQKNHLLLQNHLQSLQLFSEKKAIIIKNVGETIKKDVLDIIKNSDNKDMIDINKLTRRELKKIFEEFQQIYNVEGAMKLYDTFQEFVQD